MASVTKHNKVPEYPRLEVWQLPNGKWVWEITQAAGYPMVLADLLGTKRKKEKAIREGCRWLNIVKSRMEEVDRRRELKSKTKETVNCDRIQN